MKKKAYLGIDIGSISTKGVIINENNDFLAESYLWTEGNPTEATKKVLTELQKNFNEQDYEIAASGTTGSARKLVGSMIGAQVVKNEITAHAVGTTTIHPEVRTILEIGGQDSKIICVENGVAVDYAMNTLCAAGTGAFLSSQICVENGVAVDYAMNTLCAAGTGAFLSSQAHRLGVEVEDFGRIALSAKRAAPVAARCTVFAESDLVHKLQVGYPKEEIIAGLCKAVAGNYLNNVAKGKKIVSPVVFQGGVSKNQGVVKMFEEELGMPVLVDEKGHLMGAFGIAVLAKESRREEAFDFHVTDIEFKTREVTCGKCANSSIGTCVRICSDNRIAGSYNALLR